MDHHPLHLHGHTFYITGTEGGRIPEAAWWPGNTVLVGVAQARNVEFVANNPGDWMLHCHLPHHMMNQMSSNVGKMTRQAALPMPAGLDMNTGMACSRALRALPWVTTMVQALVAVLDSAPPPIRAQPTDRSPAE